MRDKTQIKRKHTIGRPSIESLSTGEMCLVVPENLLYIKKDFENLLPISTGGKQCILISSFGTPTENGTALQAAYDDAKTRNPSATNPITIVATPGTYKFPYGGFYMDTPYINLVSLDGNRSLLFDIELNSIDGPIDPYEIKSDIESPPADGYYRRSPCLTVEADNTFVKGVKAAAVYSYNIGADYMLPIFAYSNCVMENCIGGNESFGGQSDNYSVYPGESIGTFINCKGGAFSFGNSSMGRYINCESESGSFGSTGGSFGKYTNCKASENSFGNLTASGTYTNCTGDSFSFGGNGSIEGQLFYCQLTNGSFGAVISTGKIIYCIESNNVAVNQ